jgi:methionyl-tRNA formyltransferase
MEKQSLLFLGSKPIGYHCLYYIIQQKEILQIDLVGILTNDNPTFSSELSLKKLAQDNDIPVFNSLDEIPQVDIIYSVQYHEILKEKHLNRATRIALNLHMAPLPEYRGCNQFSFAIAENKKEFGTTIHKMDAGIDHGDILFERRFSIPENCWVNELYELTFNESIDLFIETIHHIINQNYSLTSQESLVPIRGTSIHYRHEILSLKQIDLSMGAMHIERIIRATYMPGFEPPYFMMGNEKIYFCKAWQ